ncbi:MAG: hypothetical protein IJV00_09400 [Clostridia bacterium]|nr:hypothetical protein [Clostridia bacterium]
MKLKFSFIGLVLSVLYAAFSFTLLFGVFDAILFPFWALKICFFALGLIMVIFVAAFSPAIIEKITLSMFVPVLAATAVYSLIQFGVMWILWDAVYLLLLEIALAFVYAAVVYPLVKVGIKMSGGEG